MHTCKPAHIRACVRACVRACMLFVFRPDTIKTKKRLLHLYVVFIIDITKTVYDYLY